MSTRDLRTDWEAVIGFILLKLQTKKIKRAECLSEIMSAVKERDREEIEKMPQENECVSCLDIDKMVLDNKGNAEKLGLEVASYCGMARHYR